MEPPLGLSVFPWELWTRTPSQSYKAAYGTISEMEAFKARLQREARRRKLFLALWPNGGNYIHTLEVEFQFFKTKEERCASHALKGCGCSQPWD